MVVFPCPNHDRSPSQHQSGSRTTPKLQPRQRLQNISSVARWGISWGALLALIGACGSLPTATTTLPIPPELTTDVRSTLPSPTPAPPTATPLTLTSQIRSELSIPADLPVLLVQQRGSEVIAQLPESEADRWLGQELLWSGIEGIDLTLELDDYRQTATAQLRPGQAALFTFSGPPIGAADLSAKAFAGFETIAQGQISLPITPTPANSSETDPPAEDLEDLETLPLVLSDIEVPFLQDIQQDRDPEPLLSFNPSADDDEFDPNQPLSLIGQNLDQVARVIFTYPPSAASGSTPSNSTWDGTIVTVSPTTLIVNPPTDLPVDPTHQANPLNEMLVGVANEAGLGLGSVSLRWQSESTPTPSPSPSPNPTPSPTPTSSPLPRSIWRVLTLSFPPTLDQPSLEQPSAVVPDPQGYLFIADQERHQILRLDRRGNLIVWAGTGEAGWQDGNRTEAQFDQPSGLAIDLEGNLLIADQGNHSIRRITPAGIVSTVAGIGIPGFANGSTAVARFRDPTGLAIAPDGSIYVADSGNHRIRQITPAGQVSTLAGSGEAGSNDGPVAEAEFNTPTNLALDPLNQIWIADTGNHRIRQITSTGVVQTIAGETGGFADGDLDEALFDQPSSIGFDPSGHLIIADRGNHRIRELLPGESVITLAGQSEAGDQDGSVLQAQFDQPSNLTLLPNGSIVVIDQDQTELRRIFQPLLESEALQSPQPTRSTGSRTSTPLQPQS